MLTFVIEISNPKHANGEAYERVEVDSSEQLVERLEQELAREVLCAEMTFIGGGAKLKRFDQQTGRTATAYLKQEKEVAA